MSVDKYPSIFLGQMEAIVYIFVLGHYLFLEAHSFHWLHFWKTVRFSEQIMSLNNFVSIFYAKLGLLLNKYIFANKFSKSATSVSFCLFLTARYAVWHMN